MKMYFIPPGTSGKLITQCQDAPAASTEDWVTRKDLEFTNCVTDPIRHHNNRADPNVPEFLKRYAEKGYAVYGGSDGGDPSATYLLAVPYNEVQII